jgi:hypothetical protein
VFLPLFPSPDQFKTQSQESIPGPGESQVRVTGTRDRRVTVPRYEALAASSAGDARRYTLNKVRLTLTALLVLTGLPCPAQIGKGSAGGQYAGSKACAPCHERIFNEYMKTAMGRSTVSADSSKDLVPADAPVRVVNGDISYEVERRGGELYQTESQVDASGNVIFNTRHKLEYAIGSGVNGTSYVVRRDGYLFEAPLSYYRRAASWQLSPGYEHGNAGFNRLIATACIACHSGRPLPVAGRDGLYADPAFAETAIGCENCHGPGAHHIRQPGRTTIVNPARLSERLADDICMNCHEAGDTRVYQSGKTGADFRPGSPLAETVAIFKIPPTRSGGPQSDLLEHNFSMLLSRCYQGSNGRLRCTTCHDPHATPENRAASYERKCLGCHTLASCKQTAAARAHEPAGCIGCHMPRADIGFISHSALTNHRIIARPGEPLPDSAYKMTTPDLPDLIYLNRTASGRPAPPLLLQAYGELAERAPQFRDRYLKLLDEAAGRSGNEPVIEAALGRKALRDGTQEGNRNAIEHLSKAVQSGFTGAAAFEDLAAALAAEGRTAEAIDTLNRGIGFSPFEPRLRKLLAVQYINARQYDQARRTMQTYLDIFPEDNFVRDLLKKAGG